MEERDGNVTGELVKGYAGWTVDTIGRYGEGKVQARQRGSCHQPAFPSLISAVERQGVASEINDILAQIKLPVDIAHAGSLGVDTLKGFGVILIKVCHKHQEFSEASFFKHAHQI